MTKHDLCAIQRNTEGECADTTARKTKQDDEVRSHYDFSGGVRGKYAARYTKEAHVVMLDPDVPEMAPDSTGASKGSSHPRSSLGTAFKPKAAPKKRAG